MNKKLVVKISLVLALCAGLFISCYAPNPLYGKWADNNGNTITFNPDLSYTAKVTVQGITLDYEGDYACIENVLVFSRADGSKNTEWDIRGSIMYLNWTNPMGQTETLSLYHVSK